MFLYIGSVNGSSSDTYNIRYASKDENEVIKINTIEIKNESIGFVEIVDIIKPVYNFKASNVLLFTLIIYCINNI